MNANWSDELRVLDAVGPSRDLWAEALARRNSSKPAGLRVARAAVRMRLAAACLAVVVAALALVPVGGASLGARALNGIESLWATQNALDAAANDAESIAGTYFTGDVVHADTNTVDVYLAAAPQSVIDQLNTQHPGIFVIHNDAPNTGETLRKLTATFDPKALEAQGVQVNQWGPTPDGYFGVGVTSDVATARAILDKIYGPDVVRVFKAQALILDNGWTRPRHAVRRHS